jgi:uncharacterized protein YuzE
MKFKYYPETDTFYIELKEVPSIESEEVADGVVVDYDQNGEIIGIEIEHASERKEIELPIVGKFLLASA